MGVPKDETEEQKALRLTKARKNASKAREEAMKKKYRDKILEDEAKKQVKEESEDEDEDDEAPRSTAIMKPLKPVKPIKEEVVEEEEKPKAKPKAKKPKAKVIIEQSSDDEDTFEASKDVIFVKRIRAKPKAEAPSVATNQAQQAPQAPQAPPVTRQEQPLPQRYQQPQQQQQQQQQQQAPPKPIMSQEKRLEMERYLNMTRGNFLPMSRPR